MRQKTKVFFRADGNSKIGLGHVIRSLALAAMLKEEFECHFIIQNPLPTLKEQILNECHSIIELPESTNYQKELLYLAENHLEKENIVVLDGYNFKTEYQKLIKSFGCKLVCIDDIHEIDFYADAIINHTGGISSSAYSVEDKTDFYFGLKYLLVRKPFMDEAKNRKKKEINSNIFICLGGADPDNTTMEMLELCENNNLDIDTCYVVIGAANQHKDTLDAFSKKSNLKIELLTNLSAVEMIFFMRKCSRAITSPSTISYENLCIGSELYLKLTADNQKNIKRYLIDEKLAFDISNFPIKDRELVKRVMTKQIEILDGQAPQRFIKAFKSL